ncbi:MAG: hypothetical protein ACK5BG_09990 [Pseudanabaena sp.]|jgi:PIN domain nuclease of toxin-antitoxin system
MIVLDTHIWIWWVHGDLADQIITATAKVLGCPLVTADTKILNYSGVETIA